MDPETRYARIESIHIAYQVSGDGPRDLVYLPGLWSHVEHCWREPAFAGFLAHLSSFSRLILLDTRGAGLSDRPRELPILEHQIDDVLGVLDAAGSDQAVIMGVSQSGPMAALFAATHPERTSGLILYGTYAAARADDEYPWGRSDEWIQDYLARVDAEWGTGTDFDLVAPSYAEDAAVRGWWAALERHSSAPGNAMEYIRAHIQDDVRAVLPSIAVPTLVLHREQDLYRDPAHGRYIVDSVPGSELVALPGCDHLPYLGDQESILAAIEAFVTGAPSTVEPERVLASVLFTDIVGSTERAAALGDQKWRMVLDRHNAIVRSAFERFRGVEVNTAGDGFLSTFDGPARAIRCALFIRDGVRDLGIEIRAGIHTGEVEIMDGDIAGIGVHIGARVAGEAQPGEVLVSRTVRDLVAGSGISFVDRGLHQLKGVSDEWRVFAVD
jgi:pimeloyl-ACP methyl ester carboxylesterase/class 3 adenylate cyclase